MDQPTHDSIRAKLSRAVHPGFSYCLRCGFPWAVVEGHHTSYGAKLIESYRALDADVRAMVNSGQVSLLGDGACFPLCEKCWAKLTVEEREPYYWKLLRLWDTPDYPLSEEVAHQVIAACREGL
jgi:hypothetical protein